MEARGHFRFFPDVAGQIVTVPCGSDHDDGAIAETIFLDVPVHGAVRTVMESRLDIAAIVTLAPRRGPLVVANRGRTLT